MKNTKEVLPTRIDVETGALNVFGLLKLCKQAGVNKEIGLYVVDPEQPNKLYVIKEAK